MTLLELIERVKTVATGTEMGPADPRMLDSEVLIEIILPRAFDIVVKQITKDEKSLNTLRMDQTLTFTAGVATLPDSIDEQYTDSIYFKNSPMASFIPRYEDFILAPRRIVDTFTIANGSIYYREAGDEDIGGPQTQVINAITIPVLPTLISDQVVARDHVIEQIIFYAASIVNGSTSLDKASMDF